ncbi:NAD-dependent epimerase/dehydratase family protein [Aerococcus viridans]|uniref:NAD-dependent epimerase/dehydratase family protein n=1 Tax=Aerococcus viridans TaxID=1377 RepID=UPI003B223514
MKYILITGKNSYIGTKVSEWLLQFNNEYIIDKISVRDNLWKKSDWSKYDVVFNVAGKAHQKETVENKNEYYDINRNLSISIAKKAKLDGVKHFIQLSTMSVFGVSEGIITRTTPEQPLSHYGISKLQADTEILKLRESSFKIAIIRPPMVYGSDSPGNYQKLSKFATKVRVFPKINNYRSMIHIDNLTECVRIIINKELEGFFYPQNSDYVNTFELVNQISKTRKINLLVLPNFLNWTKLVSFIVPQAKKVFGNLIYDKSMSDIFIDGNKHLNYTIRDFEESVKLTENEK